MAIVSRKAELSSAEYYDKSSVFGKHIEITTYNKDVARLIRSHLRNDAISAISSGDSELAEELIHLYNSLTAAMDKLEEDKDERA